VLRAPETSFWTGKSGVKVAGRANVGRPVHDSIARPRPAARVVYCCPDVPAASAV